MRTGCGLVRKDGPWASSSPSSADPVTGESSKLASGEPPAVLVVDDSGGRYVWRDGRYWWEAG